MPDLRSITAIAILLLNLAIPAAAVDFIAHRGASLDAPENTLAAFKHAWERGADAVELDIRLTKDGHPVCLHDASTKRTTGVAREAAASTLAELRALDAGAWKGPQWKGEKIPTLSEVLAAIPAGRRLFIEIKCGVEILPALARDLAASGKPAPQFVIISFSHAVCAQAKQRFPDIPVLLIASFKKNALTGVWSPSSAELIRMARSAGLDGLNLSYQGQLDGAFVRQVHAAELKCFAWTVNDADAARKLVAAGIDGITTDRADWLREQLR